MHLVANVGLKKKNIIANLDVLNVTLPELTTDVFALK